MEYEKYPESEWRRTFVYSVNDGGWVVGECADGWVVSLDHGGTGVFNSDDLAW